MLTKPYTVFLIHPPKVYKHQIVDNLRYPPVGLLSLAAVLRESGMKVLFYDANVESGNHIETINKIILDEEVDAVGLSFTSIIANGAYLMADKIKLAHPNIPVIAGGYHPTVVSEEVTRHTSFDYVVVGEGEETFSELLSAIQEGKDPKDIPGLSYLRDNQIVKTASRELIPDLDSIPIPAYDLLRLEEYDSLAASRSPFVTFIRSRGCPFKCNFCGVDGIFTHKYRYQSAERTVEEIEYLIDNFGVKEILFKDSDFLINKKNVKELCELLVRKNLDIAWSCNTRVDMANDDIMGLMAKAGCKQITFGVESGSQEMLDAMVKDTNEDEAINTVRTAKENGLECVGNFIIGAPGETQETIDKTIKLATSLDLDYASFNNLVAFPGSALYEEAKKNNWFLDKDPSFCGYEEMNINASHLTEEELKQAVKRAFRSFYFRPGYILKRLKKSSPKEIKNSVMGALGILKKMMSPTKPSNPPLQKLAEPIS